MALPVNEKRKSLGSYRPSANRGTVCSGLTVGEVPPTLGPGADLSFSSPSAEK